MLLLSASPYFTIPMKDQHLDEGQTATFRCYGDGIPAVTFSWLRNGTVLNVANLSPDDQARIAISSNVLTIGSVKPSDAGMYQCAVSNTHATRYDAAQLRVLCKLLLHRRQTSRALALFLILNLLLRINVTYNNEFKIFSG